MAKMRIWSKEIRCVKERNVVLVCSQYGYYGFDAILYYWLNTIRRGSIVAVPKKYTKSYFEDRPCIHL